MTFGMTRKLQHKETQHNGTFVMLSVTNEPFILSVVMLNVVAPQIWHQNIEKVSEKGFIFFFFRLKMIVSASL